MFTVLDTTLRRGTLDDAASKKYTKTIKQLAKIGYLVPNFVGEGQDSGIEFKFASPFHERTYLLETQGGQQLDIDAKCPEFREMVNKAICLVSTAQLQNTSSVGVDDFIYERQFRMEFYRVLLLLLPARYFVSPDVPPNSTAPKKSRLCRFLYQ